jgi:hypothetical protein
MVLRGNTSRKCKLALCGLLVITISSLFLHVSTEEPLEHLRLAAIEKVPFKTPEGVRQKATHRPGPALHKSKVNLNFVSYSFLLRFDFKQNLRTWPVLANDLERSPPFLSGL